MPRLGPKGTKGIIDAWPKSQTDGLYRERLHRRSYHVRPVEPFPPEGLAAACTRVDTNLRPRPEKAICITWIHVVNLQILISGACSSNQVPLAFRDNPTSPPACPSLPPQDPPPPSAERRRIKRHIYASFFYFRDAQVCYVCTCLLILFG